MNFDPNPEGLFQSDFFIWPLPVERVLYEAEQPIIYLSRTKQQQLLLAFLASETQEADFILLAPTSQDSLKMLESGTLGVREALTAGWLWLAKHKHGQSSGEVWSVTESDIPNEYLPVRGTPLLPEHRIVFSARAIGEKVSLGKMPSSVVSFIANAAKLSLKAVLDNVLSANTEGRPTDDQRARYDLPVQRLRFASFEIGLAEPSQDLFSDDSLRRAIKNLKLGLAWAQEAESQSDSPGESVGEREAILQATLALTPPSSGVITNVEISGSWLKDEVYHLNRNSRVKIRHSLRSLQSERIVFYAGRIGEIDDDNLSFTLREAEDNIDHRCFFSEDLLDDMRTHYYEANKVQISGIQQNGKLRVTAIVAALESSEPNG